MFQAIHDGTLNCQSLELLLHCRASAVTRNLSDRPAQGGEVFVDQGPQCGSIQGIFSMVDGPV